MCDILPLISVFGPFPMLKAIPVTSRPVLSRCSGYGALELGEGKPSIAFAMRCSCIQLIISEVYLLL